MSETSKTKRALVVVSLAAVALVAATAQGDILGFIPEPGSPTIPEFIWNGATLFEGPGALGTGYLTLGPGDGEPAAWPMAAPGLDMTTPFVIPGVPGGITGIGNTTFYDATLDIITPLPAAGPAFLLGPTVKQPLGEGEFKLYSTDPLTAVEDDYVLLLAGTINSAHIEGMLGATTGATLSADVTYTGGAIADAIGAPFHGSFSWTLNISAPLAISPASGMLDAFSANGTGHFTPEPGTMALLGVGALLVALRRRRNKV